MNTMNNQQLKESTPAAIEEWLSLLVLLQKLQERLAEDRQAWAATGGDMAILIESLRIELQRLQELRPQVEQEVKQSLQSFSQQALQIQATEVNRQLSAIVSNMVENTLQRLNQAAQQVIDQWQTARDHSRQFKNWVSALAIILCILSSISGGYIVHILDPQDHLSSDQWQLTQNGAILRKAWPGLSKSEQDKIMGLFQAQEVGIALPKKNKK